MCIPNFAEPSLPDVSLGKWLIQSLQAFFAASPASTAVPAANVTSPASPINWFCSSSDASAPCPGTAPRTNHVVASADVIQYAF